MSASLKRKIAFNKSLQPTGNRPVPFINALARRLSSGVEAVEKIPEGILGGDTVRNELIECTTINDLLRAKGQVIPRNIVLNSD